MKKRALFLDRDGVINIDSGYTHRKEEFQFIDGIFELVAEASRRGYHTFIVTNQAGIGRGYYTEDDFWLLMNWVTGRFAEAGGSIEKTYFCPHHPEHGVGEYRRQCACRKPAPGMLLQAAQEFAIDLSQAVFLGDRKTDMAAGRAAGVGTLLYMGNEPDYQPATLVTSPLDAIAHLQVSKS